MLRSLVADDARHVACRAIQGDAWVAASRSPAPAAALTLDWCTHPRRPTYTHTQALGRVLPRPGRVQAGQEPADGLCARAAGHAVAGEADAWGAAVAKPPMGAWCGQPPGNRLLAVWPRNLHALACPPHSHNPPVCPRRLRCRASCSCVRSLRHATSACQRWTCAWAPSICECAILGGAGAALHTRQWEQRSRSKRTLLTVTIDACASMPAVCACEPAHEPPATPPPLPPLIPHTPPPSACGACSTSSWAASSGALRCRRCRTSSTTPARRPRAWATRCQVCGCCGRTRQPQQQCGCHQGGVHAALPPPRGRSPAPAAVTNKALL